MRHVLGKCKRTVLVQGRTALIGPAHINPSDPAQVSFRFGLICDCTRGALRSYDKWTHFPSLERVMETSPELIKASYDI